jgi:hypothetical protein
MIHEAGRLNMAFDEAVVPRVFFFVFIFLRPCVYRFEPSKTAEVKIVVAGAGPGGCMTEQEVGLGAVIRDWGLARSSGLGGFGKIAQRPVP